MASEAIDRLLSPWFVRWAVRDDLPRISWIELCGFTAPLPASTLWGWLSEPDVNGFVATFRDFDRPLGYLIYRAHPASYEVLRLAVDPAWRRRRVASSLLDRLTAKLGERRSTALYDAPADALDGHLFLRSAGWRAIGTGVDARGSEYYRFLRRADKPARRTAGKGGNR